MDTVARGHEEDAAEGRGRWAVALRSSGLRVTGPRLAVLRALGDRPHADAESVVGAVRRDLGSVSTQAVYNVLGVLAGAGLVRRIEPAGSPARYEVRVGDNHHHIVCRHCGATTDVDCAVGRRPCLTPSETHGFVLDEAEVTFWGLCPSCAGTDAGDGQDRTAPHQERPSSRREQHHA
ncbi:MAG TPA: Fur family transcriptional regulator [Acidimicrobiales bacterium]|nr:Fur family transcriptional regulator [Acidimicrobiales bacterium]